MVRAGEAGGALAEVLSRLAEFMERSKELRESVKSALIYPTILLLVALASVVVLLAVVVPQFEPIFEQSGKAPRHGDRLGAGALMRAYCGPSCWGVAIVSRLAALARPRRRPLGPPRPAPVAGTWWGRWRWRASRTLGRINYPRSRYTSTPTPGWAGLEAGHEFKTAAASLPLLRRAAFPLLGAHDPGGEETGRSTRCSSTWPTCTTPRSPAR
jgi:hypothetical protein